MINQSPHNEVTTVNILLFNGILNILFTQLFLFLFVEYLKY